MDQVLEALEAAKARIVKGWCRFSMAKTAARYSVSPSSPLADSWCAVGACRAVAGDGSSAEDLVWRACNVATGRCLPVFNDDRTTEKRHILALFDWAMELRRIDLREGRA